MKIANEFTVHVPIDVAWKVLTDLEGIAPCLPGAQLTGVDGDVYQGNVKVKSGSGDVEIGEAGANTSISTGSGDVSVEHARGTTVVKTGSGDLSVDQAYADTSFSTGSGDMSLDHVHQGRITVKAASGDVSIGVAAGIPVWTDITTVSGTIRSDLQGAGKPEPGQDHIEVRVKTVSGDIELSEV